MLRLKKMLMSMPDLFRRLRLPRRRPKPCPTPPPYGMRKDEMAAQLRELPPQAVIYTHGYPPPMLMGMPLDGMTVGQLLGVLDEMPGIGEYVLIDNVDYIGETGPGPGQVLLRGAARPRIV